MSYKLDTPVCAAPADKSRDWRGFNVYNADSSHLFEIRGASADEVTEIVRRINKFSEPVIPEIFQNEVPVPTLYKRVKVCAGWIQLGKEAQNFDVISEVKKYGYRAEPLFNLETAQSLAKNVSELFYVEERDFFVHLQLGGDYEMFCPMWIDFEGETKKVYPIGWDSWCWEEVIPVLPIPPDKDGENSKRAEAVDEVLNNFYDLTTGVDAQVDLLASLRHWCDRNRTDFSELSRLALNLYEEQTQKP